MKKSLALLLLAAAIFAGCQNSPSSMQTVNSVLGDRSYLKKFGTMPGAGTKESVRIQTHLEYVEQLLRENLPSGLTPALVEKRMQMLDLLHEYRLAGEFPSNYDYPGERLPCFIDRYGKICAVGYLVEHSAGRAAAEKINIKHQYEKITDMNDPLVEGWISGSGLTMQECAMIQPSYGWIQPPADANNNHISNSYGIGSAVFGATNISLVALNSIQISSKSNNAVLPAIGLMSGAFQVLLGIDKLPPETKNSSGAYTTNESQKTLSLINIGLGTTTMILSLWNLCDNKKVATKASSWNVFGFPADNKKAGLGFYYARRF